jgi:LuxR family maltose regulon positive regulatory protein
MNTSTPLNDQLLATKFFIPSFSHALISRPRLTKLLHENMQYRLTLISAPAGFGKTTLLSTWVRSLPPGTPHVAWLSLDENDNELIRFWEYVFTAFSRQRPGVFTPLLDALQEPNPPPIQYILQNFINCLVDTAEQFLLILDDYHLIIDKEIQSSFLYLVEHMPASLHIILGTRVDPTLSLPLLRARGYIREIRTDQLRCTNEEAITFFHQVMNVNLPEEIILSAIERVEGWMVGLQLLGLSLQGGTEPEHLLEEVSGSQRYILDYLTEEVLRRQPEDVQKFLLFTSILVQLNGSLCDAVMEKQDSQSRLEYLERSNLFIVSLDQRRRWYRYHALFAEALRYRLEQTEGDLLSVLHHRASRWYAEHNALTEAILHAFSAHEWEWAATLIERLPFSVAWGTKTDELILLRHWLEQLPAEVVYARPRLCLACAEIMRTVASPAILENWLDTAETVLTASLAQLQTDISEAGQGFSDTARQEAQNLLGEVIAYRAHLRSYGEYGEDALQLCQQALALLSKQNYLVRAEVASTLLQAYYYSAANDAVAACHNGLEAGRLAQIAGNFTLELFYKGITTYYMSGAGRLHDAERLARQAMLLGMKQDAPMRPEVVWSYIFLANILREWNQLDEALQLVSQGISLSKQSGMFGFFICGYAVLMQVHLSRGDFAAAYSALQQVDHYCSQANENLVLHLRALYTVIDQSRLWIAHGELEKAALWAEDISKEERDGMPFVHEREETARARILLVQYQPEFALTLLQPVLTRATAGKRWDHVIEICLLQAQAYQMKSQRQEALEALAVAVHLGEPEGYIRRFVDEGEPIAHLLLALRNQWQGQRSTIAYLDMLLSAFSATGIEVKPIEDHRDKPHIQAQEQLIDPLSARELEVLQLLAQGASNQVIADELVVTTTTVKRHVSHILMKLNVSNRVQAIVRARELGLLSGDF